jgi:hypothetical protein
MGRRSRKRSTSLPAARERAAAEGPGPPSREHAAAAEPAPDPRPARRPVGPRARMDEAPPAPWAPVPLVEICVLAGIVLIVAGLLSDGPRSGLLLACGVALAALAGLELSVREHFAGFRSHSALLAGAAAVAAAIPLFFLTSLPQPVLLVVAAVVFAAAFTALRAAFRARTGGLGFRA